jgi:hypothetical protein
MCQSQSDKPPERKSLNWKLKHHAKRPLSSRTANSDISHMQGGAYVPLYLHPIDYAEFLIRQVEEAEPDSDIQVRKIRDQLGGVWGGRAQCRVLT